MSNSCVALLVEDDEALRVVTAETLRRDGWKVEAVATGEEAQEKFSNDKFDLLLLDQRLPDIDGIELLEDFRCGGYDGPALLMTGYPTVNKAVAAMGSAASGYLCKPVPPLELMAACRRALEPDDSDSHDWEYLWTSLRKRYGFLNVLSGNAVAREAYETAAQVANSPATVLIEGETGTGKEYLARAIHYMSSRQEGPFVAVNCGAIPDALVESELFGHEKGAFTSASSVKKGICEAAHGGTLFLDEIGELTPAAQVKLLRFLQESAVTRLGGLKPIEVDVRVVAATHRNLLLDVREGRFREDLYYRIAVIPLTLPPLRDRPEDIILFANHFLNEAKKLRERSPQVFSDDALQCLCRHIWPGNLRELGNVIQRACLVSRSNCIQPRDIRIGHSSA